MNNPRAQALGAMLKKRRKELGFSLKDVAEAAGVPPSTVTRFERGAFTAPSPDKLAAFARLLRMSLADVFAEAGYVVPDDLPTFGSYLSAKYPDLPTYAMSELSRHFVELAERHGIEIRISPPEELDDEPGLGGAA